MIAYYYPTISDAELAVVAFRNEAAAMDALQKPDSAARLRVLADQLERRVFAARPIVYRAAPVDVVLEPSASVRAVVASYQTADRPQPGGTPI